MNEAMETALCALWKRSRFTSYFYQSVRFAAEDCIPTLALARRRLRFTLLYNREFAQRAGVEGLIALLVHEMLHVILSHDHRPARGDDHALRNLAQDMVVNSYLYENEETYFSRPHMYREDVPLLQLPPGLPAVPREYFLERPGADPTWEDLYLWLAARKRHGAERRARDGADAEGTFPADGGACGDSPQTRAGDIPDGRRTEGGDDIRGVEFTDGEGNPLPTGAHLFAEDYRFDDGGKRALSFALRDSSCGEERIFQDLHGIITGTRHIDTDSWRRQIKSIVDFSSQSTSWAYSANRFNRRYLAEGVYSPGRAYSHRQAITVAVDLSGSMVSRPEEIEAAFGVIEDLLRKYRVFLVCVDEAVFVPEKRGGAFVASGRNDRPYAYGRGDWRFIRSGMSGTTLFAPLFNDYMARRVEMLIVITDGEVYDLDRLKKHSPTLWVVSGHAGEDFHPPFGRVVTIGTGGRDAGTSISRAGIAPHGGITT